MHIPSDVLGYLAALLVLLTFVSRDMRALRVLAMLSNIAFIAYAVLASLPPVLLLHVLLLPVNAFRLAELSGFSLRAGARAPRRSS